MHEWRKKKKDAGGLCFFACMQPSIILLIILVYFLVLIGISALTGRGAGNEAFFLGNRRSPWFVVAFGMIGASLSGVTFISIPGAVCGNQFAYFQMVLGYLVGYGVIALVLLPLYYRLQLTSIYTYLRDRFGRSSYKTGAAFFLLSRIVGASFRLYLVAIVLDRFVLGPLLGVELPFAVPVVITIALIWVYTWKSGIKTIIWTDTLQTAAMLVALLVAMYGIAEAMDTSVGGLLDQTSASSLSDWFFWENFSDRNHFLKQFIYGALIAVAMTGLDQDMMQKNLSCKSLKDAQKNVFSFSIILVVVNLAFLFLGAFMFLYADQFGIEMYINSKGGVITDYIFPELALNEGLGMVVGISFIIGLIASAYSSADSALTALTTSFCVDILETENRSEQYQLRIRKRVHLGMSATLAVVILVFKAWNNDAVITGLFRIAAYTYGPLLGLYFFGLISKRAVRDKWVPVVALTSIGLCIAFANYAPVWFPGYQVLFEVLMLNGGLTYLGLYLISTPQSDPARELA